MGAGRQRPGTGARDGARSPPAPPRSRQGCEGRKGERGCVPALRCTRTGDRKVRGGEAPVGSRCSPWHRGRGAKHPSADVLTAVDGGALAVSSAAPSSRTSSRRRGSGRRSGVTGTRGPAGAPFCGAGAVRGRDVGAPAAPGPPPHREPTKIILGFPSPYGPYEPLSRTWARADAAVPRRTEPRARRRVRGSWTRARPCTPVARRRSAAECGVRSPLAILRRTSAYPHSAAGW
jgi:hypothetical protein